MTLMRLWTLKTTHNDIAANISALLFICLCPFVFSCNEKSQYDDIAPSDARKKSTLPVDSKYGKNKNLEFTEVDLEVCIETEPNPILTNLPQISQDTIARLKRASCETITVFIRDDRAIFQLPPALSHGRSLDLVMSNDRGPAALVYRGEKRFWWGSPTQILDILETSPYRARKSASARFLDSKEDSNFLLYKRPTKRWEIVIEYKRGSLDRSMPSDVRMDLIVWSAPEDFKKNKNLKMLLNATLMSLGEKEGWKTIEEIKEKIGVPIRWSTSFRHRHWPESRKSVILHYQIIERNDGSLTTSTKLSAHRAALPPTEFQRRFGPLNGLDRQEVPPNMLKHLRSPLGIPEEPRKGKLIVQNKCQHSAAIMLDGFRLGFVSPGSRMVFEGIPSGYYRATANTPWGTVSFGPKDLYIPGKWTLQ